ncbi:4Fe-4S dicluster domain-containing protein [Thermoanaerobacteraceae bacterium SP2]|nr:4Fe-4S dicluster domain-containing protein [Thermoanaerobacteraceae bacterium SP2]
MHIKVDISLCSNCRACLLACSMKNFETYNPKLSLMDIRETDSIYTDVVTCIQCKNAACIRVCPSNAIKRNNGVVKIDKEKCIGCGICTEYCPQGVVRLISKKAFKCELCEGNPACVQVCSTGAISYQP